MYGKPKRNNRFEMRLNDEEMMRLQQNAEAKGLSVSEFVRDWIKTLPLKQGNDL